MKAILFSSLRSVAGIILFALVVAGCRTYGGWDSEEATLAAIQQANQSFAESLEQARGEVASLERAGATNPMFGTAAAAYALVIQQHEALVAAHRELAEELDDDYRDLHRAYGAIITDQQIIRDRYDEIRGALRTAAGDSTALQPMMASRYQAVPPFYERVRYTANPSVSDLITQVQQAPASTPAPNASSAQPDTTAAN